MNDTPQAATPPAPERSVTVSRVLSAPRELVYRAWVEPEQFAYWFGAELEVPQETLSLDVRPGGPWTATMLQGDEKLLFAGEYLEVEPPSRLKMTFEDTFNTPPTDETQTLTVTFSEVADGTEVTLTQVGPMPDGMPEGLTQGYNSFMDKLAELLASA